MAAALAVGAALGSVAFLPASAPASATSRFSRFTSSRTLVEAVPGDVLHGVVANAVVLAVVEDRHDVGVVQSGRRAGLAEEPAEMIGIGSANFGCITLSATRLCSASRSAS